MLGDLLLKNFAIIDEINISFAGGLNILTGETGAGKSVIIGALEMLFGGRASTDAIKDGKDSAYIEASYYLNQAEEINELISGAGVEPDPESLLISREIRRSGRNRCRINGQMVPLWLIREISQYLVDIHGQHEHQNLLDSSSHTGIVDELLPPEGQKLRAEVEESYEKLTELNKRRQELSRRESDRARRLDIIEYQIDEIDEAGLEEGEIEELERELKRLNNSEEIYEVTGRAGERINGSEYEDNAILDRMGEIKSNLDGIARYDGELEEIQELAESIYYSLQDLGYRLRDYHENQQFDPGRVKELEERLDLINNLRRKYGETVEEILAYRENLQEERKELAELDEKLADIEAGIEKTRAGLEEKAGKLSELRRRAAEKLEEKLQDELQDLALSEARFKVEMEKLEEPSRRGLDRIRFLIAVNPGTELKPLDQVASGGEISRIMLAFKSIIARYDQVQTMIFDEVDAGVGGKTAIKMARKLGRISRQRQVICITHLPQLASMADRHFYIEKETDSKNETVATEIEKLAEEERREELARMLGGESESRTGIEHADELLHRAEKTKEEFTG